MPVGVSVEYVFKSVGITGQFYISPIEQEVPGTAFTPEASFKMNGMEIDLYP